MIPSDALAVDGSARRLTSLVVVPGIGSTIGAEVGGRGVADSAGVEVEGRVAVTNSGVGRTGVEGGIAQPAAQKKITDQRKNPFRMSQ